MNTGGIFAAMAAIEIKKRKLMQERTLKEAREREEEIQKLREEYIKYFGNIRKFNIDL